MIKWLKKYLISHKANNYKPHILRDTGVAFVLALIIVSFVISLSSHFAITRTKLTSLVLSGVLVDFANNDRAEKNFGHLAVSSVLQKAAQLKANDMAEKSYFAHTSPEGKTPWYWFRQAGYDFTYAGENLAINFNESVDVNQAWMNSPGHRANILNDNFTEIGIATAEGVYQGKPTTFVVQLFGTPKSLNTTKIITETKKISNKNVISEPKSVEPKVLSESISVQDSQKGESDLYIAVENEDETIGTSSHARSDVTYSSFLGKIISSPRRSLSIFYTIISTVILISLISMCFVEKRREHYKMMFLSAALLLLMFAILYFYRIYFFDQLLVI